MREDQRSSKMRLILLVLFLVLSACSGINYKSDKNERSSTTNNPPRLTDNGKFIHDDSFRIGILQSCDSTQTFERKTSYGSWHKLKDCDFKLHGISIKEKDVSVHKNLNGLISGIRFMVYPDTEYGQHLLKRYQPHIVDTEPGICIQYYLSTLPILTIADKSLCEAVNYRQIWRITQKKTSLYLKLIMSDCTWPYWLALSEHLAFKIIQK